MAKVAGIKMSETYNRLHYNVWFEVLIAYILDNVWFEVLIAYTLDNVWFEVLIAYILDNVIYDIGTEILLLQ